MQNKIRKDDLEALGEMAGLLGAYMNDYVSKTDADARQKLFKGGFNIRHTMSKAISQNVDDDVAQQIIPDDSNPVQPQQVNNTLPPQPSVQNITQPTFTAVNPVVAIHPPNDTEIIKPNPNQMVFDFMNVPVERIGSVKDIIQHFDKRLDYIEDQVKLIMSLITDIRANLPKKRKSIKNETEKIA